MMEHAFGLMQQSGGGSVYLRLTTRAIAQEVRMDDSLSLIHI